MVKFAPFEVVCRPVAAPGWWGPRLAIRFGQRPGSGQHKAFPAGNARRYSRRRGPRSESRL